ncbi:heme oxygenase (biliverdin-producing) [Myceligenerans pegani]|uniref:Biliverdin-producing heme oxygenase n=1 Tax=Myceligenerans pegani TaxID=2776917 RepID=A0ABR9N039_9MICO|nr:biliverdin-producing heme oxygenase [Myceligenerans sp. TRM 65318]MBE1876715.1 biliverdin-producing heme oxygenase [Myceligenerans sp. TRM 65318]MBE3018986.1 biliverdin-producing heme oxygenase [Myceligenerans sp. TRM 65318]
MSALPADAAPTLSALLRDGTRDDHTAAESEPFIEHLMSGDLDRAAYADLAAQQLVVYEALEEASAAVRDDARGGTLVFDELTRVPVIEQDLAFLYGPAWREEIRILPAAHEYAARIREVGSSLPHYAAHAYTRYLGDLSGGQIVRRMMERHYGLDGAGLAFYSFPEIPKSKVFKDVYRERLDGLRLDGAEVDAVLAEARLAFRLNRAVFAALAQVHRP